MNSDTILQTFLCNSLLQRQGRLSCIVDAVFFSRLAPENIDYRTLLDGLLEPLHELVDLVRPDECGVEDQAMAGFGDRLSDSVPMTVSSHHQVVIAERYGMIRIGHAVFECAVHFRACKHGRHVSTGTIRRSKNRLF
ncbi:hypothetical protein D3C80_1350360 [compost metagenome]